MKQYLFEFEEKQIPPAIILATAMLYAVFAVGIVSTAIRLAL